jgi:hypothetical protein
MAGRKESKKQPKKGRRKKKHRFASDTTNVTITKVDGEPVKIGGPPAELYIVGENLDSVSLEAFVLDPNNTAIDTDVNVVVPDPDDIAAKGFPIGVRASPNVVAGKRKLGLKKVGESITNGNCAANSTTCSILTDAIVLEH